MTDNTIFREFSLGPGEIFIAPGKVSAEKLFDAANKAGDTEGGCVLKYEYKSKELYDVWGNLASTLRFGEKVSVTGKLRRIGAAALSALISGDGKSGGRGQVSVMVLCPLPDGEYFRLYLRGAVPDRAVFTVKEGGTAEFAFSCGMDLSEPEFSVNGIFGKGGDGR